MGSDLGEQAARCALARACLVAEDVDLLLTVSVTGIAAFSPDTRLAPWLGCDPTWNACRSSNWARRGLRVLPARRLPRHAPYNTNPYALDWMQKAQPPRPC